MKGNLKQEFEQLLQLWNACLQVDQEAINEIRNSYPSEDKLKNSYDFGRLALLEGRRQAICQCIIELDELPL